MKEIFFAVAILISYKTLGQFAIVKDPDGFTNVRAAAEKGNNIIDTLNSGHIIYCFEKKGNWISIDYIKNNTEGHGFIYEDRFKEIASYVSIPLKTQTSNSVILAKDSITVIVSRRKFDKTKHRFKYYRQNPDQIEKIDNAQYWGTDGGMPATEYQTISVQIGKKTTALPLKAYKNLYEPNLYTSTVFFDKTYQAVYIQSMNSDGAGGYEVIWKIENGVYTDRLVVYGF